MLLATSQYKVRLVVHTRSMKNQAPRHKIIYSLGTSNQLMFTQAPSHHPMYSKSLVSKRCFCFVKLLLHTETLHLSASYKINKEENIHFFYFKGGFYNNFFYKKHYRHYPWVSDTQNLLVWWSLHKTSSSSYFVEEICSTVNHQHFEKLGEKLKLNEQASDIAMYLLSFFIDSYLLVWEKRSNLTFWKDALFQRH